jgi:hypothetical protein
MSPDDKIQKFVTAGRDTGLLKYQGYSAAYLAPYYMKVYDGIYIPMQTTLSSREAAQIESLRKHLRLYESQG